MVGSGVAAGLSPSHAIEAVRLLNLILARLDIVADNGRQVLCAFAVGHDLHDRLCLFMADVENDEDDGCGEDCHRTSPRAMPPRLAPPAPRIGARAPLASPGMIRRDPHAFVSAI